MDRSSQQPHAAVPTAADEFTGATGPGRLGGLPMRRQLFAIMSVVMAVVAVTGSGAFTAFTAERTVSIEVVGDQNQFLRLEPAEGPNGDFVTTDGGTVAIDLSNSEAGVEGVGADGVTRVDRILRVSNQGTQSVAFWITDNESATTFFVQRASEAGSPRLTVDGRDNAIGIEPGESVFLGVAIGTEGVDPGTQLLESVTIHANANVDPPARDASETPQEVQSLTLPPGLASSIGARNLYGSALSEADLFCLRNPSLCPVYGGGGGLLPITQQRTVLAGAPGDDNRAGSAVAVVDPAGSFDTLTYTGEASDDEAGTSVAVLGDVNDDGNTDYLIGAPGNDQGGQNAGAAYLVYGPVPANSTSQVSLSNADIKFVGKSAGDNAGAAVANAGDVDGDGDNDILIGAPGANGEDGEAYLITSQRFGSTRDLSSADRTFVGTSRQGAGGAVAGAGDVDDDGNDDILIGGDGAYLIYGGASGSGSTTTQLSTGADVTFSGTNFGSAGSAVAGAGDIDGDGVDDILIGDPLLATFDNPFVGTPNNLDQANTGAVYVIEGSSNRMSGTVDLEQSADATLYGQNLTARTGASVAGIGDVTGDGTSDILVGAPQYDDGGLAVADYGAVYFVEGGSLSGDVVLDANNAGTVRFTGKNPDDRLGTSVSRVSDVDGDGTPDFVTGARFVSVGGSDAGAAFIYSGSTRSTITSLQGNASDELGTSVAG